MASVELTVTVLSNRKVQAKRDKGGEASADVQWDSLRRDTIGLFEDWLNQGKINKRKELEVLGAHLYSTIFNGDVEKLFEKSLGQVPAGERLRVQLSFSEEASDLAGLPWEYLYCPGTGTRRDFFLATNVDLVLSRFIPLAKDRERIELGPDERLRILVVVAAPDDKELGPVVARPVIDAIKQLEKTYPIKTYPVDKPTVDNLVKALKSSKPHVLHFIGHGRYSRTKDKGEIALLAPDGEGVLWYEDKYFAELFVNERVIPHLVFLHLCEATTVKEEFRASFCKHAYHLIMAEVQAVVAMQYPITTEAAIAFSQSFYGRLAKGEPIDNAVQRGRWRITTKIKDAYDSRVFGTPVLYMHSRDGVLLPKEEERKKQTSGQMESYAVGAAPYLAKEAGQEPLPTPEAPPPDRRIGPAGRPPDVPPTPPPGPVPAPERIPISVVREMRNKGRQAGHDEQLDDDKIKELFDRLDWRESSPGKMRHVLEEIRDLTEPPAHQIVYWTMLDVLTTWLRKQRPLD